MSKHLPQLQHKKRRGSSPLPTERRRSRLVSGGDLDQLRNLAQGLADNAHAIRQTRKERRKAFQADRRGAMSDGQILARGLVNLNDEEGMPMG